MNYTDLQQAADKINTIRRWRAGGYLPAGIIQIPILLTDRPQIYRSEVGVSLSVTALDSSGWHVEYVLDFDPDHMPTTETEFWNYLNTHIFIRLDYPEKTVPPPTDPASQQLYIPTALRAHWVLSNCPYIHNVDTNV